MRLANLSHGVRMTMKTHDTCFVICARLGTFSRCLSHVSHLASKGLTARSFLNQLDKLALADKTDALASLKSSGNPLRYITSCCCTSNKLYRERQRRHVVRVDDSLEWRSHHTRRLARADLGVLEAPHKLIRLEKLVKEVINVDPCRPPAVWEENVGLPGVEFLMTVCHERHGERLVDEIRRVRREYCDELLQIYFYVENCFHTFFTAFSDAHDGKVS